MFLLLRKESILKDLTFFFTSNSDSTKLDALSVLVPIIFFHNQFPRGIFKKIYEKLNNSFFTFCEYKY